MSTTNDLIPSTTKNNKKNLLEPCIENPFFRIASSGAVSPCIEISKQRSHDLNKQEMNGYLGFQPIVSTSNQRKRKVNIITDKGLSSNNIKHIRINKDSVNSIDFSKMQSAAERHFKNHESHDINKTNTHDYKRALNKNKNSHKLNLLDTTCQMSPTIKISTPPKNLHHPSIHINPPPTITPLLNQAGENTQPLFKGSKPSFTLHKSPAKAVKSNSVEHHKNTKKSQNGALDFLLTEQTKKKVKKKKRGLSKHKSLTKNRNISVIKNDDKYESQAENISTAKVEQSANNDFSNSIPNEKSNKSCQNSPLEAKALESKVISQSIEAIKKPIKRGTFSFCSLFSCTSLSSKK